MSDIPTNVLDPQLYRTAKAKANEIYGSKTSAYKNMYMVKVYKELGGRYSGAKTKGLTNWDREKWIRVEDYVKSGKKLPCGEGGRVKTKACRPTVKVNKSTPITLNEALRKHGRKKILELVNKKQSDMAGRIDWNEGTFTSS